MLQAVVDDGVLGEARKLVANLIIDGLVHIGALDREADLAAVLESAGEDARGASVFGSTSSSTIAASLPPSSSVMRFKLSAALDMTFLPVAVEPVNEILRMSGCFVIASPRSLASAMMLKHAGRQNIGDQFGETQRRERRRRRGLHHHRIAGDKRRRRLEGDEQQRIIPGQDRADDAERAAMGLDPAVGAVLDHPHRQVQGSHVAEEGRHAADFVCGVRQRLALFGRKEARQFGKVGLDDLGDLGDCRAAMLDRRRGPCGESRLGGRDGLVELGLGCARAKRDRFFGRGIEHRRRRRSVDEFAIDEQMIARHSFLLAFRRPLLAALYRNIYSD